MGGRLAQFAKEWESLTSSAWHLRVVKEGLTLPFHTCPPLTLVPKPIKLPNHPDKRRVLLEEVDSLLLKEALELAPQDPGFFSHLFTVPKATGGFRPVIDLKGLNRCISCPHFHMETDAVIRSQLQVGEWTTSIDLKDAYLHIPVHPGFRKYLRFHIRGVSYQFRAMCFGLNIAPRVFTKLLTPAVMALRRDGVKVHRYLDDWLIRGGSLVEVRNSTARVLSQLQSLGFIVNNEKSDLVPRRRFVFLGMDIDLSSGLVRPSPQNLEKVHSMVSLFLSAESVSVRQFLSLLGLLNYVSQFSPLARLRLRPLQFYLKTKVPDLRDALQAALLLDTLCKEALQWWSVPAHLGSGVPLHPPEPELTLATDASLFGWSGVLEGKSIAGRWSADERRLHISALELRAIYLAVSQLAPHLQGKVICLLADNVAAVAYLRNQGGTHSISLFQEARKVLELCARWRIVLQPHFIPGKLNSLADLGSRGDQVLATEWMLHKAVISRLLVLFPDMEVDLFATRLTAQLPRFVSPCPDPRAWKVDALSIPWDHLVALAYPPTKLLGEVVRKLHKSSGRLLLVAPCWPNMAWFADMIGLLYRQPLRLPAWRRLLRQPGRQIFHSNPRMLDLHVWPLSGRKSDRAGFRRESLIIQQHHRDSHPNPCTSPIGESSLLGVWNGIQIRPMPLFPC